MTERGAACLAWRQAKPRGVDVDAEIMGGDGTVPPLFFFRDHDKNTLMIAQE